MATDTRPMPIRPQAPVPNLTDDPMQRAVAALDKRLRDLESKYNDLISRLHSAGLAGF